MKLPAHRAHQILMDFYPTEAGVRPDLPNRFRCQNQSKSGLLYNEFLLRIIVFPLQWLKFFKLMKILPEIAPKT